jgi:hypothetical protein
MGTLGQYISYLQTSRKQIVPESSTAGYNSLVEFLYVREARKAN